MDVGGDYCSIGWNSHFVTFSSSDILRDLAADVPRLQRSLIHCGIVGYATGTVAGYQYTLVNPVTITKTAVDGSYSRTVATVRSATNGPLSAGDTFPQSTWIRWSEQFFNRHGQQTASRVYHSIPASGEGTAAANFDETTYGYDDMNRQNMMRSPGGTIIRTVFDVRGQAIQTWVGTADAAATQAHPNGDDSNSEGNAPGNNRKKGSRNRKQGARAESQGNSSARA